MSQSVANYWKFAVVKSLRRSPWVLVGGWLLSAVPETPAFAAGRSPELIPSPSLTAIADRPAASQLSATVAPESYPSPQFGQSPQSTLLVAQAIVPAADGTGTTVNQTGNNFEITGGTQAGENLFHSFQQFGLSADQAATILSSPDIANILGRVVGGDASFINGLLQVTGGNSNLFLMNPAGIIFGPDATVVMPAAFTATTADAVEIGDYWFEAMGTPDYANLIGDPTGFAFTSDQPGMVINAGSLTAAPDSVVTLLGGFVLNTGSIETAGGIINIAAVPGENWVRITPEGSLLSLELPLDAPATNTSLEVLTANDLPALLAGEVATEELGVVVEGDIVRLVTTNTEIPTDAGTTIVAGSLDASDAALDGMGGEIDVLGDQVALIEADLNASGTAGGGTVLIGGDYQGQGDVPNADFTYVDSRSAINADALENGDGGTVIVWADDTTQFFGDISARGGSEGGNGGFVEVSGQQNLGFNGTVDVGADQGMSGLLLLDPQDIQIVADGGANDADITDGKILAGDGGPDAVFTISWDALQDLTGDIELAATNDITVADGLSLEFTGFPDSITFMAGGTFAMDQEATLDTGGASLAIAAGEIIAGDIVAGDVSLTADTGDIVVQTITADGRFSDITQGITVDAAGQFRALGTQTTTAEVQGFRLADNDGIPQNIADLLVDAGFDPYVTDEDGEAVYSAVNITFDYSVAITGVSGDAPEIVIKYGEPANRVAIEPITSADNNVTVIGDPDGYLLLGPEGPSTVNAAEAFGALNVTVTAPAYEFPSDDFPAGVSGLVSGIGFVEEDGNLTGSLQSKVFGQLPPPPTVVPPPVNPGVENPGNNPVGGNPGGGNPGEGTPGTETGTSPTLSPTADPGNAVGLTNQETTTAGSGVNSEFDGIVDPGIDDVDGDRFPATLETDVNPLCDAQGSGGTVVNRDILEIDERLMSPTPATPDANSTNPCVESRNRDRPAALVFPTQIESVSQSVLE
jgi:filamentous hemagglutinin family protein